MMFLLGERGAVQMASPNTTTSDREQQSSVAAPSTRPLQEIAEEVRRDSEQQAESYLERTAAPFGGE